MRQRRGESDGRSRGGGAPVEATGGSSTTEWMAEKPLIIAETVRYFNSASGKFPDTDGYPLSGDFIWEDCSPAAFTCNNEWYEDYLDKGKQRHLESFMFWFGDGSPTTGHLVRGESLDPDQGPGHPTESTNYGWRRYQQGTYQGSYRLGTGGQAIRAYTP